MSTVFNYRLEDFLLFSHGIYYDLIADYNSQIWPLHLPIFVLFCSLSIGTVIRPGSHVIQFALLVLVSACLFFIANYYFLTTFTTINWSARYMANGFFLQSALVLVCAAVRWRKNWQHHKGQINANWDKTVLLLSSLVIIPAADYFITMNPAIIPVVGIDPDTTMMLSLALVPLLGLPRVLAIVPTLWLIVSCAMHHALGAREYLMSAVALIFCLFVFLKDTLDRRKPKRT